MSAAPDTMVAEVRAQAAAGAVDWARLAAAAAPLPAWALAADEPARVSFLAAWLPLAAVHVHAWSTVDPAATPAAGWAALVPALRAVRNTCAHAPEVQAAIAASPVFVPSLFALARAALGAGPAATTAATAALQVLGNTVAGGCVLPRAVCSCSVWLGRALGPGILAAQPHVCARGLGGSGPGRSAAAAALVWAHGLLAFAAAALPACTAAQANVVCMALYNCVLPAAGPDGRGRAAAMAETPDGWSVLAHVLGVLDTAWAETAETSAAAGVEFAAFLLDRLLGAGWLRPVSVAAGDGVLYAKLTP